EELDEIQARAEKIFLTGKDSGTYIGIVLYFLKSNGKFLNHLRMHCVRFTTIELQGNDMVFEMSFNECTHIGWAFMCMNLSIYFLRFNEKRIKKVESTSMQLSEGYFSSNSSIRCSNLPFRSTPSIIMRYIPGSSDV